MVTGDSAGRETVGRGAITELPHLVGSPTIGTVIRGNATGELDALVHLSKRERRGGGEGRGGLGPTGESVPSLQPRVVARIVASRTRHGRRWSDQNGERIGTSRAGWRPSSE